MTQRNTIGYATSADPRKTRWTEVTIDQYRQFWIVDAVGKTIRPNEQDRRQEHACLTPDDVARALRISGHHNQAAASALAAAASQDPRLRNITC